MNTTQGHQKHARKPVRRSARTSSGNLGLLGKVLATLLAVNMAIMLALPIGIFADDIANNGVTNVEYGDGQSTPAPAEPTPAPTEPTPAPTTTEDTGGGSADPGAVAGATPLGGDPLAITPAGSGGGISLYNYEFNPIGTQEHVSTWAQFAAAWSNAAVSVIILDANITRGSADSRLSALNRNLKVTSNAAATYSIDLGIEAIEENAFLIAPRTAAAGVCQLGFYNVKIGRSATSTARGYSLVSTGATTATGDTTPTPTIANTAGWEVIFSNVSNGGTSTASGLVNTPGGKVVFDENVTWYLAQTGTAVITSGTISFSSRMEITEGATVNMSTTNNTTLDIVGGTDSYFIARPGAVVNLKNLWTGDGSSTATCANQTIWYHGINGVAKNHFTVDGATITGESHGRATYGDQSGVFNFNSLTNASGGNATNHFTLNIVNGGQMIGTSYGHMAAFTIEVIYGEFNISGPGSKLELTSSSGLAHYVGTLRFREVGNQRFNVTNYGEVNIHKLKHEGMTEATGTGQVPGIRFGAGANNSFYVNSGGKVYVETYGTGTPLDPAGPTVSGYANTNNYIARGSAINVGNSGFRFDVKGEDSIISLKAFNGAAFSGSSYGNLKIDIGEGASFLAWGRTASADAGIIRATGNSTGADRTEFKMEKVRYYDFRNLRPGGGLIFQVGSNAYFDSIQSNLSVWTHKTNPDDLEGDPTATWWKFTYGLTGTNFSQIKTPPGVPSEYPNFITEYGNATRYSRMSANNASAYLEPITDLTNADKSVRAFAHVPEGLDAAGRPAWSNEIWGYFLRNGSGQLAYTSHQFEDVYSVQTGQPRLYGVLKYDTGSFLIPGDTYSLVKDAWRGAAGDPPSRGYVVPAANIPDDVATVRDVTPPDRVTVTGTGHEFNTTTYTGKMWSDERVLEGTYPNMAASASAAWNGESITRIYAVVNGTGTEHNATLDTAARTWRVELPAGLTLAAGDTVSIVAVDSNGNENPITDEKFHDTTFPAASKLTVEIFPLEFQADHPEIWIGLDEAKAIVDGPPTGLTAINERLRQLIGVTATLRPGSSTTLSTDVIVTLNGGFSSENFTQPAFGSANKTYTITYAIKDYPAYTGTATVGVYPYKYYIEASDFLITEKKAANLLATTPDAAREATFIELAKATACAGVDSITGEPSGAWSPANVVLVSHTLVATAGTTATATFAVKGAPSKTKTITITVTPNNEPVLNVTNPIKIWTGSPTDPNRPAGSFTPAEFLALGGSTTATASDPWMYEVTAYDYTGGAEITDDVTYTGALTNTQLNTTGLYTVHYTVTNSDSRTVDAYRTIAVNIDVSPDGYILLSRSFVVRQPSAGGTGTGPYPNVDNIVGTVGGSHGDSDTIGYKLNEANPAGKDEVPVGYLPITNGYGVDAAVETYPITVTIPETMAWPAARQVKADIVARVVSQDVLTPRQPATTPLLDFDYTYAIAANNVGINLGELSDFLGTGAAAQKKLIERAVAQGWKLDAQKTNNANTPLTPTNATGPQDIVVSNNGIPAGAVHGGVYNVTFAVADRTNTTVTVTFEVTGSIPVITFDPPTTPGGYDGGSPLVIQKTAASHELTPDELKAKVSATDVVDTPASLLAAMRVHVPGGAAAPTINTMNVGVYRVAYDVTNSYGLVAATAYRAIVVTDGRYAMNRGDGANGIIIGAQDFVQRRAAVNGNIDQARDWSFAEAFDIEGNPLTVTAARPTGINNGVQYDMQPLFDDYPFVWSVAGRTTTKTTTGRVVNADSVWPGTKNNPYAVTAKDFTVNSTDAASIMATDSYITAADAKAYKLVSTITGTPAPYINARGVPTAFAATEDDYPGISFGVQTNNALYGDGATRLGATSTASITGHVRNGNPPDLQVSRPLGIASGSTFDPMTLVSATDVENGNITDRVKYNLASALSGTDPALWTDIRPSNPLATAGIGLYPLTYWVIDNDYRTDVQNRVVVVNDGRYALGQTSAKGASGISVTTGIDGKILYGRSFVVKKGDVGGSIDDQIISNAAPSTFNGSTGQAGAAGGVSVLNRGGYSTTPNNYMITLQTSDVPSGVIQRNIVGKVVDATTLANNKVAETTFNDWSSSVAGQVVTPAQNGEGAVTYVYGTSIPEMLPSAATAIVSAANPNAALIAALKASAVIATPGSLTDTMTDTTVKVVSVIKRGGGTAFSAATGEYRILISDTAEKSSIWLTISVGEGNFPWVVATPKPLNITAATTAGFITDAQIRAGVTAGDVENGDLTSRVTYKIYDTEGTLVYTFATGDSVTTIPRETAGFYRVVYTVQDNDGNESAPESRALLVNDGRYTYDDEYVIEARSFVIGISEILANPGSAQSQIIEKSGARAWNVAGNPASLEVKTIGSYGPAVTNAQPELSVVGYAPTVPFIKTVTARIYDKGDNIDQGQGVNGERYSLRADNFRINITEANALKANTTATYASTFVSKAGALSYDRSSSNFVQFGTVGLESDGGFRTAIFAQPGDAGYPTRVPITFSVNEETGTTVTVYAVVSNGTYPTITVTTPKSVALNAPFGETQYREGVTAHDSENGDITSRITYAPVGPAVNTAVQGIYTVKYDVTDLEGNAAESQYGIVLVGLDPGTGDYVVQPVYNFVTIPTLAPVTDAGILAASYAKAWRVTLAAGETSAVEVSPIVYDDTSYATTVGDHPVTIGVTPVAPYTADVSKFPTITAKVVDRTGIATDNNPANTTHYAVAANVSVLMNLAELNARVGLSNTAKANLIDSAMAVAYKMDLGSTNPMVSPATVSHGVDVKSNAIPASPVYGTEYPVVFTPTGQPGVELTVMFKLFNDAHPSILFSEDPLVVTQTATSHIMTADELKAQSTATNYAGANIKSAMTATPATGGTIDQHNIGIYLVNYYVKDTVTNLETTAQRYVIVDDGRYDPIDEDGDGDIDVIIGARNFLTKSAAVTGGIDEVRAWSFAEAYDNNSHTSLTPQLSGGLPTGWGAAPAEGTYNFTWFPAGHPTVTVTIKGIVKDADVIDTGDKNSQYGMIGYHFAFIGDNALTLAQDLINKGDAGFVAEARAEVILLVDGTSVTPPAARVIDRGGFAAVHKVYDIRFGAQGQPDAQPTVTIEGTVYPTLPPEINLTTPINIWTGDAADPERPAGSILPGAYTSDMYQVTAHSDKDGDITSSVTVSGDTVDLTTVGLYRLHYAVVDSDGRTDEADRVVVVNDGRIVVGDGRVLLANGFVIKSTAVVAPLDQQLKDKSGATLFDGETGDELSGALITVANPGGYSATAGTYTVTFTAPDTPSGTLTKTITAEVVDAGVIGGPEPPDPFVDSTYTYGTSITVTTSEMAAIIAGGDAKVLEELGVHATKTKPNGTLESVNVKVVSYDKPLATTSGVYTVTVSDVNDKCAIPLTISTWIGPEPVITAPRPIVVQWTSSATNLTQADLMDGTYAPKSNVAWHVTADDGGVDVTADVTITDPATGLFPVIPHNVPGTYQVRYYVEDVDGNYDEEYRSVIIDDGNIIYDDEYVLEAASFVIGLNEVNTSTPAAQILAWSNAVATTTEGYPAVATVPELGAYGNPLGGTGDKKPIVSVSGHSAVSKEITARVYDKGDAVGQGQGDNGTLYSLLAKNFRINITDANALKALTGDAYNNAFITRSAATSYLRNDSSLVQGGTVEVVSTDSFRTAIFAQPTDASYPTRVPITLRVSGETSTTVTIYAVVHNGTDPTITAPHKHVALNSSFGPTQYLEGVTAYDNEDRDITSAITYVPTKPVNTAVKGTYWADYTVVDSDYNTVTQRGFIFVDQPDLGNYDINPYFSFVMISSEVTGTDAEIVAKSHAQAWRIDNIAPDNDTLPLEVPSALTIADKGGYSSAVGEYTIKLGINPTAPYTTIPANFPTIKAKVIDQDLINTVPDTDSTDGTKISPDDGNDENKDDPTDSNRYTIAATKVIQINSSEVAPLIGLGLFAKDNLISAANAVAYKTNGSTGTVPHDPDVIANEITAGATVGSSFYVTFVPKGVPSVWIKVKFVVSDGNPPAIITGGPLEVEKTTGSQLMTTAELMQGVTATDLEDGPLTSSVVVTDPKTSMAPQINKNTVGIYQVRYTVTDADGNSVTADRAIIVTDGRYDLIPDNPSKPGEITYIIGAKNFVVRQADCATTADGQRALAKDKSYLEVFDATGTNVTAQVDLQGSPAAGFLDRQPGPYAFTWVLAGHPLVVKSNTGTIVSNDYVVDPGDKNSSYALVAKSFTVDISDAKNITAEPAYVSQADAVLVKLVDAAPDKSARLINNGGFVAAEKTYKITFGDDTSDRNTLSVTIDATVSNSARTFTVTFNPNGGSLVGPSRISVIEPSTTLPYMPASPIRSGYTFRHWSTSSANNGAQFAYDTKLTGDITLYALWDAIPPVVIPEQPPINVVVNPPAGGGGTTVVTAPPTTVINNIPETPTPTTIAPTPTPLPTEPIDDPVVPEGPPADPTWSLLDLLATILAALLLVVFFIKFFFDRPRDEVYEEEPIDAQLWAAMTPEQRAQYQARRESDYHVWLSDQQRAASRPKTLFVNAPVLLIVGAGLVEALIVLFMTQDFSGRMIVVDDISVVFAAVLFIQCLAPMVAAAIRNNRRADQRFNQTPPPAGASVPTA